MAFLQYYRPNHVHMCLAIVLRTPPIFPQTPSALRHFGRLNFYLFRWTDDGGCFARKPSYEQLLICSLVDLESSIPTLCLLHLGHDRSSTRFPVTEVQSGQSDTDSQSSFRKENRHKGTKEICTRPRGIPTHDQIISAGLHTVINQSRSVGWSTGREGFSSGSPGHTSELGMTAYTQIPNFRNDLGIMPSELSLRLVGRGLQPGSSRDRLCQGSVAALGSIFPDRVLHSSAFNTLEI